MTGAGYEQSGGQNPTFFIFSNTNFHFWETPSNRNAPVMVDMGVQIAYGRSNGLVSTRGNLDKSVE